MLRTATLVPLLLGALILGVGPDQRACEAAGGDFATPDFVAAESLSYDHLLGGGAYDLRNINVDVVEQLQGGDYLCGDIVTFLTRLELQDGPDHQIVRLRYLFGAKGLWS